MLGMWGLGCLTVSLSWSSLGFCGCYASARLFKGSPSRTRINRVESGVSLGVRPAYVAYECRSTARITPKLGGFGRPASLKCASCTAFHQLISYLQKGTAAGGLQDSTNRGCNWEGSPDNPKLQTKNSKLLILNPNQSQRGACVP